VVVHPWTSRGATTYLITLDGAPLAVLGAGQHVVWRTAPRDLILDMQSRDGLQLTHFLRAEPGGTYYFRTSRRGLGRTTQAGGQALVEFSRPPDVQADWARAVPSSDPDSRGRHAVSWCQQESPRRHKLTRSGEHTALLAHTSAFA
jgi:hypothetical protein